MSHQGVHDHEIPSKKDDPLLIILTVLFIMFIVVSIGTIGYRIFGKIAWIDAFHNGALVFTATSVIAPVNTYNGKIFSAFYNLFSAIFVLVILGIIFRKGLDAFAGEEIKELEDLDSKNLCNCCSNSVGSSCIESTSESSTNIFDMLE